MINYKRWFTVLYGLLSTGFILGLEKVRTKKHIIKDKPLPTIAVCVAARNEESNIPDLIKSLAGQNYTEEKVSFWIVDDESNDKTFELAEKLTNDDKRFHILRSDQNINIGSPKKRALTTAINQTDAKWIVTTDADCRPGSDWLKALAQNFSEDVAAVVGYSPLIGGKTISAIIAMGESWSAAALAAAGIGLGFPFNAFGRNLAFQRQIFIDRGGYGEDGKVASGDDDLLLQRLAFKTDYKIEFAAQPESHVKSVINPDYDLIKTKSRHLSVGTHYAPGWLALGFVGSLLFMGLGLATLLALLGIVDKSKVSFAWKAKWSFDTLMIISALRVLGDLKHGIFAFLAMTVAPFVFWVLWPKALFGDVSWKGRTFTRGKV